MGMGAAIMSCLEKFMIFTGRAPRAEFWWFFLAWLLAAVAATALELALGTQMISIFVQVVFLLPTLAAGTRRLHDTGRPGYYLALPFLGLPLLILGPEAWGLATLLLLALLLLMLALPGARGANRYGPDPRVAPDLDAFE